MRHIRNFFHNINDIVLAVIIVALAVGIIYWRMQIILDYPKELANERAEAVQQQEEQAAEEAAAEPAEEPAAEQTEEPADDAQAADTGEEQAAEEDASAQQ